VPARPAAISRSPTLPPAEIAHAQVLARILVHEAPVRCDATPGSAGAGLGVHVDARAPRDRDTAPAPPAAPCWPEQHVEQRRLARAGFADDRQHLAGPQIGRRRPSSAGIAPKRSVEPSRRAAASRSCAAASVPTCPAARRDSQ
jgi:hypothetical protein